MSTTRIDKDKIYVDGRGESGHHGQNGSNASGYSSSRGENGGDGLWGEDGTNADKIDITLSRTLDPSIVSVQVSPLEKFELNLNPQTDISLNASGGSGGNGGDGGKGGNGADGQRGSDATQYSNASNGHPGYDGGSGGRGGAGGVGGDGGDINIRVDEKDLDLLMLVSAQNSGGYGGVGGSGGRGGNGGTGGSGGDSYTWNQPMYHIDTDGHTHITYITHTNYSGSRGSNGSSGSNGQKGIDGKPGRDGKFRIEVPQLGSFSEKYNPQVKVFEPLKQGPYFAEPGEKFNLQALQIENKSFMPLPPGLTISINNNNWISFEENNSLIIEHSLSGRETIKLHDPLTFQINTKKKSLPAVDKTFVSEASLEIAAKLPRVNRYFPNFMPSVEKIAIRYPVEISTVAHAQTILLEEEAPFVAEVRNISSTMFGDEARKVHISLMVTDGISASDMQFFDPINNITHTLYEPYETSIKLGPQETYTFAGTLKFINNQIPAYTTVKLTARLWLEDLNTSEMQVIQERNFSVQLANTFKFDPNADFVLITNHKTSLYTISQWQQIATSLGSSLSIWNTSLYDGLSYKQKRKVDNESFMSQLANKVVIILNDDAIEQKNKITTDNLDQYEIFEAAKEANISTYVMGAPIDLTSSLTPQSNAEEHKISANFVLCKKPKKEDFTKKAEELHTKLLKDAPTEHKILVCDFKPKIIHSRLLNKWELGNIKVVPSLDKRQAHIATRLKSGEGVDQTDIYTILKLLPFSKKLAFLDKATEDTSNLPLIASAILSDLADELSAFSEITWKRDYKTDNPSSALISFNTLINFQFLQKLSNSAEKNILSNLLLQIDLLAHRFEESKDKYLFPHFKFKHLIARDSKQKIEKFFAQHFPEINLKDERKKMELQWQKVSRDDLLQKFSQPIYAQDTKFDTTLKHDILDKSSLPVYQPKQSSFREGLHFFHSPQERKAAINKYAEECQYELPKPGMRK